MVGQEFEECDFVKFVSKGNLNEGVIYNTWLKIWNQNLNRKFTYDYEVFGEKSLNPTNAEVDIFVSIY